MYQINPNDKHLVEEFRAKPIGHHSADLQKLLNVFRGAEMADKYILVCTKPHEEWILAQLSGGRGDRVRLLRNQVFHSIHEAEWEVFKLRWHKYTGENLDD